MKHFSSAEIRRHTGELLDLVLAGEIIAVTRHGRITAYVIPAKAYDSLAGAHVGSRQTVPAGEAQ